MRADSLFNNPEWRPIPPCDMSPRFAGRTSFPVACPARSSSCIAYIFLSLLTYIFSFYCIINNILESKDLHRANEYLLALHTDGAIIAPITTPPNQELR